METEEKREGRWSVKWVIIACLPLLLLVLYFGWRLALKARVRHELAWFRAQGYPTTLAELDAWYPEPEGENAADAYQDAFGAYRAPWDRRFWDLPIVEDNPPPLGKPLSAKQMRLAREFLDANRAALAHARRAVAIPECRFPIRFLKAGRVEAPHLPKLRQVGLLPALESLVYASRGRREAARGSVEAGLKLGRSLAKEPLMTALMVRETLDRAAVRALERTLNLTPLSDAGLKGLGRLLEETDGLASCTRPLVGDAIVMDDWMRRLDGKSVKAMAQATKRGWPAHWLYVLAGGRDLDRAFYLRTMGTTIEVYRRYPTRPSKAEKELTRRVGPVPRYCLMSKAALLKVHFIVLARRLAAVRTARAALAVERFRLERGRRPATLRELVPAFLKALPLDPFTDKPLIYRKLTKGFVVYSIGLNAKDDGGKSKPSAGWDDISFRILRGAPKQGKGQ